MKIDCDWISTVLEAWLFSVIFRKLTSKSTTITIIKLIEYVYFNLIQDWVFNLLSYAWKTCRNESIILANGAHSQKNVHWFIAKLGNDENNIISSYMSVDAFSR